MVLMAISTINFNYLFISLKQCNALFRIIRKNKKLTIVSNRYFRDLSTSTEFYGYFGGVANFGESLLWEIYGDIEKNKSRTHCHVLI